MYYTSPPPPAHTQQGETNLKQLTREAVETPFRCFHLSKIRGILFVDFSQTRSQLTTGRIRLCSIMDPKIIRPLKTIPEHFSFEVWTVRSASNHTTKWSEDHQKNRDHLMYR